MSKKPRKSRHRIPLAALDPRSDPISERYQAEVDRDTNRLQKAFEAAQRRVERARARAERVAVERIETEARAEARRLAAEQWAADAARKHAERLDAVAAIADAAERQRQREVAEAEWHREQTRIRLAEERREADLARVVAQNRKREQEAQRIVRIEEVSLAEIVQLMQPGNHASRSHRGVDSFRPAHLGTPKGRPLPTYDCPSCGASGVSGIDPHEPWCPASEKASTR